MGLLEETTIKRRVCMSCARMAGWLTCWWAMRRHDGYFVDLYVRKSNAVAIGMYEKFGYVVYRQVINYYSGEEDAYGALVSACVTLPTPDVSASHTPVRSRHAQGDAEGRAPQVGHPAQETRQS